MKIKSLDSLASLYGALGDPLRDKAAGTYYTVPFIPDIQLIAAYQSSWLANKIVNIPADDAFRNGWDWQASADQITAIESEMNRLGLISKAKTACIRGRLFGGGAIVIGTGDGDLSVPLDPARVGKGGLRYLTVVSRKDLSADELVRDVASPYFGEPEFYTLSQTQVRIHTSRLVKFFGQKHPDPEFAGGALWNYGWSDSILISKMEAVKSADAVIANINSLVFEANIDVFGVSDLLDGLADEEYEQRLTKRFALSALNKSINRAIIKDEKESYDRKTISFSGLDAIIDRFVTWVAGAADIPATRLFGMSPSGMSSTGESDLRNYYDHVNADQKNEYTPAMSILVECLIRSALGARPTDVFYLWSPLWQLTAVERSTIGKTNAETAKILVETNLVQPEAVAEAIVNRMTEDGVFPGLESAVADLPEIDFEAEAERERKAQEAAAKTARTPVTDMAPRPLYVSRRVVNHDAIRRHFEAQGLSVNDDLHVTIAYSRAPLDWLKVGESWAGELKLAAGGPRVMERFHAHVVLSFASHELFWRNQQVMLAGGSHDFEEYQPHITITKQMPGAETDIDAIEPWTGEIILGPEIFEPIKK